MAASAAAAAAAAGHRWASIDDWNTHRKTITNLYETKNMKLQEVMKIMETEHNFHATARMYKTRFHKWGLQKTLKFQQVGELLRQNAGRTASGKQSVRLINGKEIDDRRLKKYIRSLSAEKHSELTQIALGHGAARGGLVTAIMTAGAGAHDSQWSPPPSSSPLSTMASRSPTPSSRSSVATATAVTAGTSCRMPSPGPAISHLFHLAAPEAVRAPEECIFVMRQYVAGSVDSGRWALDAREVQRAGPHFGFWNLGRAAKSLLAGGQTRQAFRLLNNCFHEYRALLTLQNPQLYLYTYLVAVIFADGYPALCASFLRYAASLAGIVYSEAHPLPVLLAQLSRMGPEAARDNVVALTQAYVGFCCLQPGSVAMLDVEALLTMQFSDMNIHGHDVSEATLRSLIERLAPYNDVEINQAITFDLRDDLAVNLMRQARFDEARELLVDSLESPILPKFPMLYASCLRNMFRFSRDQGYEEEALRAGHQLVKFAHDTWGLSDDKTIRVMTDFKEYLRKVGDHQTADRLNQDFETAMDELSKGIEDFELSV